MGAAMTNKPEPGTVLRQVEAPAGMKIRGSKEARQIRGGVVAETSPGVLMPAARRRPGSTSPPPRSLRPAFLLSPPIVSPPIVANNGGGAIGSGLPVQLI